MLVGKYSLYTFRSPLTDDITEACRSCESSARDFISKYCQREAASEALERESEKGVMTTSPEVTEQPKEKCPIN